MVNYIVSSLTVGVIVGILTLGLNVSWGWVGQLDLAFYGIVAIGAYIGGVMELPSSRNSGGSTWILGLSLPFPIALIGGMAASALAALALGSVALRRLRGDYFAITTVAFALILTAFLTQQQSIFNGFEGLYGLQQPFEGVLKLSQSNYQWFFLGLCIVLLGATYWVLQLLYVSPFGRTLRAIREDETAAAAFGRNAYAQKLKAYVVGGTCAGMGGVLLASYVGAWNPSGWAAIETFLLYTAIFLGGQGNSRGVLLGTLIALVLIPEITRWLPEIPGHPDLFPAIRNMVDGALIIGVLWFRPRGLVPERQPKDREIEQREGQLPALTTAASQ